MRNAPSPGLVILTVFIGLHVAGSVFAETPILDDLPPGKTGVLESPVGTYEFTTTVCRIFLEDNFEDIEIMGPGTAPDGENFYFELSSTGNSTGLVNLCSIPPRHGFANRWRNYGSTSQIISKCIGRE